MVVLPCKHLNLQAHNIEEFLVQSVQPVVVQLASDKVLLDLSFNRLDDTGLRSVVSFMEHHPLLDACVGYNNFTFPVFYNVVAEMQHTDWIESERIHMGSTEFDRKLDKVAALNMQTAGNLDKMQLNMTQMQTNMSDFPSMFKDIGRAANIAINTGNWATRYRESFEDVVTSVLLENLIYQGYTLLDRAAEKYCKLPYHQLSGSSQGVDAVEWDGVLWMERGGKEYTFLVEAKKTNSPTEMLKMPERIVRTKSFMEYCSNPSILTHATKADKARCYIWSLYKDSIVRGVIGADVLPPSVVAMVKQHQLISISHDPKGWIFVDEGATP